MTQNKKSKILLVDDDADIAAMVSAWLPADEFTVYSAANGKEGLEKLSELTPDLILLDVLMPEMNGYEFCEKRSSVKGANNVPIVFLTGLDDEQNRGKALALGAIDYLVKPVKKQILIDAVGKGIKAGARWLEETSGVKKTREAPAAALQAPSFSQFKDYLKEQSCLRDFIPEVAKINGRVFCDAEDHFNLSPEQRSQLIANFMKVDFLSYIASEQIELGTLSPSFCIKNAVVPIRRSQGKLYFAMANPFNLEVFDALHRVVSSAEPLRIVISSTRTIRYLFGVQGVTREFGQEIDNINTPVENRASTEGMPQPTVAATHSILAAAVSQRASDIHVEPKKSHYDVRFRVDGEMKDIYSIEKELGLQMITRLKALAGMDIAQRRKPQDGAAEFKIHERLMKFRFATTATPFGESVIVRILDSNMQPKKLENLGMTEKQAVLMNNFASRDRGFVLIVGPTGSGKTTTVYSIINLMDCKSKSVMTIEDPVEYWIPYANQQQVNEKAGMTFESVLKSSVRQDPDILFLGEVREGLSAKTAFDFTSTGHLTIATLHTSNATTALFRLERLGVSRAVMADTILGVVAQRLIRKICDECAAIEAPTQDELKVLKQFTSDVPRKVAHPRGCIHCNQTGYFGRVAIYEIIEFDPFIAGLVRNEKSIAEIRQTIRDRGGFLMADHVLGKVRDLIVAPEEAIQRVLAEEASASDAADEIQKTAALKKSEISSVVSIVPAVNERILLVDDDLDSRLLITRVLENRGFEVTASNDAVEALLLIGKKQFDLIISDINMPNLDGFKFMEMLQQKGIKIPVAFLTGDLSSEMEQKCLASGAVDYFKKPIDKNILVLRVQHILQTNKK